MKLEIKNGGDVVLTIEGVGAAADIITIFRNSTISFSAFNELYEKYLPAAGTYVAAYERVEKLHENLLGRRKYSDYETFRKLRSRNKHL